MSDIVRVLYVEDEDDIREVAEFALEDEGFELNSFSSGVDAIEGAADLSVDLILLDVMMPGLDGPSTLQKLREIPGMRETPVIFMTAKIQPAEIAGYLEIGALGVINKPFDPMTLADEIRALLQKHHG